MKKLLIFGISGLTGSKLGTLAISDYDVFGTYNDKKFNHSKITSIKFDIQKSNLLELLKQINPDIVINTTALHNVDYCETNPDDAYKINSNFIEILNEYSQKFNFKLIHISTDYVFDGKQKTPYSENDPAIPLSVYGNSKLHGEKILLNSNHVVVRTSVVYGWSKLENSGQISSSGKPMNFAVWLLNQLKKQTPLKIVTDQFATATLADSLAQSILKIAKSQKSGLYHISGLSCESRYDFSIKLAKEFGYDSNLISKTDSSQFKQKAKRPSYSCLDSTKFMTDFDFELLETEDALKIMKQQVFVDSPDLLCK